MIDMLKPDDFVAYEIKGGAEYDVRDYTVTITDSDLFDGYEIVANGHLWFGE